MKPTMNNTGSSAAARGRRAEPYGQRMVARQDAASGDPLWLMTLEQRARRTRRHCPCTRWYNRFVANVLPHIAVGIPHAARATCIARRVTAAGGLDRMRVSMAF